MQTTGTNGHVDVDAALGDVARIYRSITGQDLPRNMAMAAPIPPERDPQEAAREALARLSELVMRLSPQLSRAQVLAAPVDCWETENGELILVTDVPGIERDTLKVRLERGAISFSGRRPQGAPERAHPTALERGAGMVARSVLLPPGFNAETVEAELDNGVLRIRVVRGNKAQDREIEVR